MGSAPFIDDGKRFLDPGRTLGHPCRPGGLLDRSGPPGRSRLITHGHADHARGGHGETLATPETLAIMALRYDTRAGALPANYGEAVALGGSVSATWLPAGHVLGSAQILLEHAGERVIVTGDFKRRADPTCAPFAVTPCDVLITEATFGLPVFRHPPVEEEMGKLLAARAANPDRCVLVGAYALGKAQRRHRRTAVRRLSRTDLAARRDGTDVQALRGLGVDLGDLRLVADVEEGRAARRRSCSARHRR
jgi:putative mRNA 3-end processing factor